MINCTMMAVTGTRKAGVIRGHYIYIQVCLDWSNSQATAPLDFLSATSMAFNLNKTSKFSPTYTMVNITVCKHVEKCYTTNLTQHLFKTHCLLALRFSLIRPHHLNEADDYLRKHGTCMHAYVYMYTYVRMHHTYVHTHMETVRPT